MKSLDWSGDHAQTDYGLVWSDAREVQTSRGLRLLRTATPSGAFWQIWRNRNAELRSKGISVAKHKEQWEVCWWQELTTKTAQNAPQSVGAPVQDVSIPEQPPTRLVAPGGLANATPVASAEHGIEYSWEQKSIFTWFKSGIAAGKPVQFIIVKARAGTGKTFTIVKGLSFAPEERKLYGVFNKKNQREAVGKITDSRVDVKTWHGVGYGCIRSVWQGVKADDNVEHDRLASLYRDLPEEVAGAILKLTAFAKNTTINPTIGDLIDLATERDVNCENYTDEEAGGWTVAKLAQAAYQMLEISKIRDRENRISFNDMVWLPVAMNWVRPIYDLVVGDETQDLNMPQLEMAIRICKKDGRICLVGDDRQAIYSFRGATQGGMAIMKSRLNATELSLTTTYRCPKKVVAIAAVMVPDYKAADSAPEGVVEHTNENAMLDLLQPLDAVLSRLNAPLMPLCLQLLRKGVPARIEGRDIGKQLANLAKKMKAKSVPDFIRRVESWAAKQRKRIGNSRNSESKLEAINDQMLTLTAVAEGATNVSEIFKRLIDLFQDSEEGMKPAVVFSSVHKAKGLEWDRVFLLSKTFNRKGKGPQKAGEAAEEQNIYYVAVTRAKKHLVFCAEGQKMEVKTIEQKQNQQN